MLNDKLFREFKSQPFQQSYYYSHQFEDFRETLMIDEILKCGQQIIGTIGVQIDDLNEEKITHQQDERVSLNKSDQTKRKQKAKYIYEYDYGKNHGNSRKSFQDGTQSPVQEISFTLSNEDNRKQELQSLKYDQNINHERHIKWKSNLIETNVMPRIKEGLKHNSSQNTGKYTRTIKTFQKSPSQQQQLKPKPSVSTKQNDNEPIHKRPVYKTPQKMTKLSKKTLKVPLSQQITKNVYGKLKTEVQDYTFLQDYESRERRSHQESEQRWKSFLYRSEKWTNEKKNNILQIQMNKKYSSPQRQRSKQKNGYTDDQYSSYISLKVRHHPIHQNSNEYTVRNEHRRYPENTFKIHQKYQGMPQQKRQSKQKRQSSVQNCINKLKTQTELLKVKLLSPLKKEIESNTQIEHYKQLNESQSRKSIKKYRQNYEERPFARTPSTLIHVKNLYGNCIGERPFK